MIFVILMKFRYACFTPKVYGKLSNVDLKIFDAFINIIILNNYDYFKKKL